MPYPPNTPLGRFGIETSEEGAQRCVATIPVAGMVNPLTGAPTIAPLAMLVDHVGGLINHSRRAPGEWTVSSELSLEVAPDAADVIAAHPDDPVVGRSRPLGRKGSAALGLCETGGAATVLMQLDDPVLNNSVGAVHGGVSSMGLELVGSAAVHRGSADAGFRTASLQVNFLRPFHGGAEAHYLARPLHAGRRSGVAETQAVGDDGRVAMVARLTAYR